MQIFVTGLAAQADRFCVPIELIMVEWNPPPEKPGLAQALIWTETEWVESRIIQVPAELHRRYKHSEGLPLYQMIAKNVGIRRSRGEFVLATNIDLLFSDELFEFLADRRLSPGKMYRVDRWDADENVPLEATIDEQLAYCATHLLRINGRGESFPVTATGERIVDTADINVADPAELAGSLSSAARRSTVDAQDTVDLKNSTAVDPRNAKKKGPEQAEAHNQLSTKEDSVALLSGFYQLERGYDETYRWASSVVAVNVKAARPGREVYLDVDPTAELGPVALHFRLDKWDAVATVDKRSVVKLRAHFPVGGSARIEIRVTNADQTKRLSVDPRDLGYRVYSIGCTAAFSANSEVGRGLSVSVAPRHAASVLERIQRLWNLWRSGTPGVRLTLPVPRALMSRLRPRFDNNDLSFAITGAIEEQIDRSQTPHSQINANGIQPTGTTQEEAPIPETDEVRSGADYLHTNACGDFTLMSREDWCDLRGYPEWDMYSMNIDSALCISAARAGIEEIFLTARVYHIEHEVGSGYSPEGQQVLWERLRKKGIGWIEFQEIYDWDRQLRRLGSTMIFNRRDWGLIEHDLPDETVSGARVETEPSLASQ